MEKKYSIEFSEQSKSVVAKTKIECESESYEQILKEAIELFDEAFAYAHKKTLQKVYKK